MRHYEILLKGRTEDTIELFTEKAIETHFKEFGLQAFCSR